MKNNLTLFQESPVFACFARKSTPFERGMGLRALIWIVENCNICAQSSNFQKVLVLLLKEDVDHA